MATECPEPLCPERALPALGRPRKPPGGALPPRRRSYGLMRQTIPLPAPPVFPLRTGSLQVLASPCWRMALPDIISATLVQALGPIPRRAPRLHLSIPSPRTPASPHGNGFGARIYPHMAASVGSRISWLQSFDHLRAPALARPPDCSDRSAQALGRQAFHTTHSPAGYPDRDVASLHVRHGQLTWLDSHQLGRSLVGCSLPHTAQRRPSPPAFGLPRLARQSRKGLGVTTSRSRLTRPMRFGDTKATTVMP